MKILGCVTFLLFLGGIWGQSNRNTKSSGKSVKKAGANRGGDAAQPPPGAGVTAGSSRSSGGPAESEREGAAAAAATRAAGQQTDDMRLHFLRNTQVTCNDGTAAG